MKLSILQDDEVLYYNETNLVNGIANFTLNDTWGLEKNIHGGLLECYFEIDNLNYGAIDNTTNKDIFNNSEATLLF